MDNLVTKLMRMGGVGRWANIAFAICWLSTFPMLAYMGLCAPRLSTGTPQWYPFFFHLSFLLFIPTIPFQIFVKAIIHKRFTFGSFKDAFYDATSASLYSSIIIGCGLSLLTNVTYLLILWDAGGVGQISNITNDSLVNRVIHKYIILPLVVAFEAFVYSTRWQKPKLKKLSNTVLRAVFLSVSSNIFSIIGCLVFAILAGFVING